MKRLTKTKLKQIIREEIQKLNEGMPDYYEVEYHDIQGGHGSVGNYPKFNTALKKAVELYKREKKEGELGETTNYIGVSSNTDKFDVVYVDNSYFKRISGGNFGSSSDYKYWLKVAKKSLSTQKPQIGEYQ